MAYEEMPVACPTSAELLTQIQERRGHWEARGRDIVSGIIGIMQFGLIENDDETALAEAQDYWSTYYANCCRCGLGCHDRDPMRVIAPPCGHFHCSLHEGRGHQCTVWRCEYEDDPL